MRQEDIDKYSKKVWIITAVLAVVSIIVDLLFFTGVWGSDVPIMRDSAVITLLISGYILIMSIKAILYKIKEEKGQNKD